MTQLHQMGLQEYNRNTKNRPLMSVFYCFICLFPCHSNVKCVLKNIYLKKYVKKSLKKFKKKIKIFKKKHKLCYDVLSLC